MDDDQKAQFKTYRKVMLMMGKAFRYSAFASFVLFMIHMGFLKKYPHPETEAPFCIEPFLNAAKVVDFSIHDFWVLMTKPGMTKMLPDRLNIPG